jgi:hypothetical protein
VVPLAQGESWSEYLHIGEAEYAAQQEAKARGQQTTRELNAADKQARKEDRERKSKERKERRKEIKEKILEKLRNKERLEP